MSTINKIRSFLDKALPNISGIFFIIGIFATFAGVVDRTFGLNLKTVWAEELTRFCMIAATMLLMGIGIRKGSQTSLTILTEQLPKKWENVLKIVSYLLVTVLFSILMYYGFRSAIVNRDQLSPVMQLSMFYPYLIIPIASITVLFEVISGIYEVISNNSYQADNKED